MSVRIEEKISIHSSKLLTFKKWILFNNGKKIYAKRKINSIYFDTKNFNMYQDSEEGCSPRMKIRIRYYNDSNFYLEKKTSTLTDRLKVSQKIDNDKKKILIEDGIFVKKYGICYPKVIVSYMREYFKLYSFRITIDTDIQYKLYNSIKSIREKSVIVEVKSKNIDNKDEINNLFHFPRTRFSKYCRAISSFYF